MKILAWIFGIVIVLFTFIYGILFTSWGNDIIKPLLQTEIQKQTHLKSELITFKVSLNSLEVFLKLNTKNTLHLYGKYSLFSQSVNLKYVVDFQELSTLEPLHKKKLSGILYTNGTLVGDMSTLDIIGKSMIAYGKSSYMLHLIDMKLASLKVSTKNVDMVSLMLLLSEKPYINAKVDLDFALTGIDTKQLKGDLTLNTHKGRMNRSLVKKDFGVSLAKNTNFDFSMHTALSDDEMLTKLDYKSALLTLKTKKSTYNVNTKKITSDYQLDIARLNDFYFLTKQHIKGALSLTGDLVYEKEIMLNLHTKIAGGSVDAKLHKHKLRLDAHSLQSAQLLDMFYYPQVIKAKVDANLNYDTRTTNGHFKSKLNEGIFANNKLFKVIKKYTRLDLNKEKFRGNLDADIAGSELSITMDMFSDKASISTKKALLNAKTKTIDALLRVESKSNTMDVKLEGKIQKPKVKIQVENLMIMQILNKYMR